MEHIARFLYSRKKFKIFGNDYKNNDQQESGHEKLWSEMI